MELVAKKQEEENKSLVINFLGVESVDDSFAVCLQQLHENMNYPASSDWRR
jgi:anti-anti-sigma regulatory factor